MALARAYNRWLIDKWLSPTKGFYGALCLAPQDPEGSAEEIKQLKSPSRSSRSNECGVVTRPSLPETPVPDP